MADDTQFDPFAGVITPQMLQMQRALAQQQQMRDAGSQTQDGRQFGARVAGLTAGNALGASGGSGSDLMSQIANQNQQALTGSPPPMAGGTPQGAAPGVDQSQSSTQQSAVSPYEARAQDAEQKAATFYKMGNYGAASQFMSAAQIYRKQGLDAQKVQAETYKDIGQGNEAQSKLWDTPQVGVNPSTGKDEYFQTGPGGAIRWTGAPARPQVAAANVTINQEKPFLSNFASTLDKYKVGADTAVQGLAMLQDARQKLSDGIMSGYGSDARVQFGTLLNTLGFKGSANAVANTQAFIADTKALALGSKPSGMSRITNFDIQYLEKMSSQADMTPESIEKILDIRQKAMEGNIKAYNRAAGTLSSTAASQKDPATKQALGLATALYPTVDIPDSSIVPKLSPADAAKLPKGAKFRTLDGLPKIRQ